MLWGKERQMKVGDLFTKRDFKSRIFVVSRQIYVIRNANHWFCVYLGELSGPVVIPLGQLFRDPSWHWEVEKCFYMYDPTPTIHLTFDYGNYLRCEQGELIQRKKDPLMDLSMTCLWKEETTEICVATPTVDLERIFQSLEAHDHYFVMARKRVCELCYY